MRTVDVFIEIIKSVLNHDKSIDLPSDINWAEIYKLAQEQNVSSLVYDGLVSLNANADDALLQQWEQGVYFPAETDSNNISVGAERIRRMRKREKILEELRTKQTEEAHFTVPDPWY